MRTRRTRWRPGGGAPMLLCAALLASGAVRAADSEEFWPELSAYYRLNPQARLFLDGSWTKGKESDVYSGETGLYADITLKALQGKSLLNLDWQRDQTIWMRAGYDRIFDATGGTRSHAEDRGVLAIYAKATLPGAVVLESRLRADLRWIGGDYSTRYRFRVEANRDYTVLDHTLTPYLNVECLYDTRYDGWARTLYQGGSEFTVTSHFRFELYLARQADRLPTSSTLNAAGVVAKWYY